MADAPVLRLITIGSVPSATTFDSMLRDEVLPTALTLPGIVDARIARRFGPANVDERAIATIWESHEAMDAAVAATPLARLEHDVSSKTEILPLAFHLRFGRPDAPARILRIFRGEVRPGELDLYVEDARLGAAADAATSHGPSAFLLSPLPPARFVSLSLWGDWSEIELSSGSDIHRPIATQHADRIVAGEAAHFEILPSASGPARSPVARGAG